MTSISTFITCQDGDKDDEMLDVSMRKSLQQIEIQTTLMRLVVDYLYSLQLIHNISTCRDVVD